MQKLDVVLAVPGLPFNGKTFDSLSIGGSESAGYYMGRALAKLGHRVTVFCNTEPMRCEDVDYLPLDMFAQYVRFTKHDVCIVQRMPELLSGAHQARYAVLWCHDLAMKRQQPSVYGTAWNYDKILVLSEFQRQQYKAVYDVPDNFLHVTRNGVDLASVGAVRARLAQLTPPAGRNPLSLVYSARPERGLDVLLGEIMPRILKVEPNARLFLSSYLNPVDHLKDFYAHCNWLAEQYGGRVQFLGNLTKQQLYEVYFSAGLYVYPLPSKLAPEFDEISCISAMEAQACGLPFVTSARGALPETLANAGVLIKQPVHTPEYYEAFADACLSLMRSPQEWREFSRIGLERAQFFDWLDVAKEWSALFEQEIRKNSADLATMANHFWRMSDIYAARECLDRLPQDDARSAYTREKVEQDWAFLTQEDGFRLQYEKIGGTHNPEVINWSPQEPRYAALREWLQKHAAKRPQGISTPLSVLDYGCAHGGYATNLLKELPFLNVTGVDIDQHGIELAYRFADQLGVSSRWRGVVGDLDRLTDPLVPEMCEQYDVVLAQEVLEHVADPRATLAQLEQRVKDGGTIYITVPFGPWEYSDYRRRWAGVEKGYPYRAHIWEFDLHDLHDLLDVKGADGEVTINVMPFGHSPELDMPLGWHVIQYKVTEATRGKLGTIDMERKLWLQRPRQTVSVAIIAGGQHVDETMHWSLKSLEHLADEIVIVECMDDAQKKGWSDEVQRMLSGYDSRVKLIRSGPDPKTQGFETPRNLALKHCTQDWVLWIDMDEKMLQPEKLNKYLRPNIFNGYSIRQHHFAVDTTFDADLPVRAFRNPKYSGTNMQWFGMIHEHPETALNVGPGRTIVISDVHIPHLGYLIESGRQQRFNRNLPMLQADMAKYPDRKLQKHFIMRDLMLLCSQELQRNGMRVTEQIKDRAREVVRLYREHFLGKGHFTNQDPIIYYSQALQILGEGFDSVFQFSADKLDAKPNGVAKVRFASVEDAVTAISHRVRETASQFEGRYY